MNIPQLTARQLNALDRMKKTLGRRLTNELQHVLPPAVIRRALDEAEQTAIESGFPHLVFPLLAEETVERVSRFMLDEVPAGPALVRVAA
jgi:hypothetical protein